jgi:HD-like signal output (HDOD) protein
MYVTKLAVLLLDEKAATSEIVDLAKLDPSLVGMILKTVNSAYYNLQRKISDIQHAILLLGFNQIYQLAMAEGIRSTMPTTAEFQKLQSHCIQVSIISSEISKLFNIKSGLVFSTIGLLHDIGKSIILLLGEKYPKLRMVFDAQSHAEIGSLLLKNWNIPDMVCSTVEYQQYPEFSMPEEIPEKCREAAAVLYIAHLCYDYLHGKKESELPKAFLDDYLHLLRIPKGSFSELVGRTLLCLLKKVNTYPESVREFLMESESRLKDNRTGNFPVPTLLTPKET